MKEVNLLGDYLHPDEHVLALCGAHGEGSGVLACTDRRLVFLFVGLVRKQFLEVPWIQAKHVIYTQPTRTFAVFTTKVTRLAVPAMLVRVNNVNDAQTIANAARSASAVPRLDVV